jgi:hypothetical protein
VVYILVLFTESHWGVQDRLVIDRIEHSVLIMMKSTLMVMAVAKVIRVEGEGETPSPSATAKADLEILEALYVSSSRRAQLHQTPHIALLLPPLPSAHRHDAEVLLRLLRCIPHAR